MISRSEDPHLDHGRRSRRNQQVEARTNVATAAKVSWREGQTREAKDSGRAISLSKGHLHLFSGHAVAQLPIALRTRLQGSGTGQCGT